MDQKIRDLLQRVKQGLSELYGPRLKGVYLFGSEARGEADQESDIDLLIVLDQVENYSKEIERTSQLIAEVSLMAERSISRVFASEQRWRDDQSMFFLNLREEVTQA